MRFILLFLFATISLNNYSQNKNAAPCSSSKASQFDFWLGDWDLVYNDTLHASNHIEKIMGNCTVQENFYDPNVSYNGKSWSVYNPQTDKWQQTWVDDQGGYIDLTGEMQGDSMVLMTREKNVPVNVSATGKLINRMIYHHIKQASFDWEWESSGDGGVTWKNNWHIHYQRKNN